MALPRHGAASAGRHRDLGARMRRRRLPWLLIGLAAAAALLVGAAVAIAVSPGAQPSGVAVEDFDADPAPSWALQAPAGAAAAATADGACTVGRDRALVVWDSIAGFPAAVTLLDTAEGTALWSLDLPLGLREAACVSVAAERQRAVLALLDAEERPILLALDLAEGAVAAEARGASFIAAPAAADGDVLALTPERVARLAADDLAPVWSVAADGPSLAVGETVVAVAGAVHDLADGARLPWEAQDAAFAAVEGVLLAVERNGADASIGRVDERTGEQRWRLELPDGAAIPLPGSGLLLVPDAGEGRIDAVRVEDGGREWSIAGSLHPDAELLTASGEAGIALLPLDDDPGRAVVVHLATGRELSRITVSEDGAAWSRVLAITSDAVVLAAADGARLTAGDPATGEPRWSAERPADAPGSFALLGGRFLILGPVVRGLAAD